MQPAEISEVLAIKNIELPDVLTATAHTTDDVDTQGYTRALLFFQLGTGATGATVDIVVSHSTAAAGTDATLFTATQLTEAGGDDEKLYYLDIDLLNPNIRRYLTFTITVGTDVVDGAAVLLLFGARREPVTQGTLMNELDGTWATGIIPS